MENWPDILPAPRVTMSGSMDQTTITNQMDSGTTRQRKRFTALRRKYKAKWTLNNLQYGMFEIFVRSKISQGADAFSMELPMAGNNSLVAQQVYILGGNYEALPIAGVDKWEVSATLQVDDIVAQDDEVYEFLINLGEPEIAIIFDMTNRLYFITDTLNLD